MNVETKKAEVGNHSSRGKGWRRVAPIDTRAIQGTQGLGTGQERIQKQRCPHKQRRLGEQAHLRLSQSSQKVRRVEGRSLRPLSSRIAPHPLLSLPPHRAGSISSRPPPHFSHILLGPQSFLQQLQTGCSTTSLPQPPSSVSPSEKTRRARSGSPGHPPPNTCTLRVPKPNHTAQLTYLRQAGAWDPASALHCNAYPRHPSPPSK